MAQQQFCSSQNCCCFSRFVDPCFSISTLTACVELMRGDKFKTLSLRAVWPARLSPTRAGRQSFSCPVHCGGVGFAHSVYSIEIFSFFFFFRALHVPLLYLWAATVHQPQWTVASRSDSTSLGLGLWLETVFMSSYKPKPHSHNWLLRVAGDQRDPSVSGYNTRTRW